MAKHDTLIAIGTFFIIYSAISVIVISFPISWVAKYLTLGIMGAVFFFAGVLYFTMTKDIPINEKHIILYQFLLICAIGGLLGGGIAELFVLEETPKIPINVVYLILIPLLIVCVVLLILLWRHIRKTA